MNLITAHSKSSQVAEIIKGQIISGELKANTRLQSVRILADKFKLGRQVILSAFSILSDDKLIYMKPRQGAFVMDQDLQKNGERVVYILGYGIQQGSQYFEQVLKLTCPPYLQKDYSFIIKNVPLAQTSPERFNAEINNIKNNHGIDAVIINAATLTKQQIKACEAIPAPVIFLGGFQKGKFTDLKINQVTIKNAFAEKCFEYFIVRGHKKIALLISSLKYSYNRELVAELMKKAEIFGVELSIYELPSGIHSMKQESRDSIIQNELKRIKDKGIHALILNGVLFRIVQPNLDALNINVPEDLDILTSEGFVDTIPCLETDFTNFYNQLYLLLDELNQNKTITKRCQVYCELDIITREKIQ
jgi:DNA-binding LacI/PurR family transcriptional regulator